MSLEVLKCPNCGAPMPADVVAAVVVCAYCSRSVANPAALRAAPQAAPVVQAPVAQAPVAQAPVAQAPVAQAPVAQAPVAQAAPIAAAAATAAAPAKPAMKGPGVPAVSAAKPVVKGPGAPVVVASKPVPKGPAVSVGKGKPTLHVTGAAQKGVVASDEDDDEEYDEEFEWSEEGITEYAQECLGEHGSLFFHPKVPKDKLKAARKVHDASLDSDERVLVLFDDTVFGGADDGFIVTVEQLAWKNIMEEPKQFYWSDIDPEQVEWSEEGLTVMGEAIQISQADGAVMYPALGEFIYEMASMAAEDDEDEEEDA